MRRRLSDKGFLIVDALIAISILAVSFVFFMGGMAQVLRVSTKSSRTMEALSTFESLLFQIDSGVRPDLAGYGGIGALDGFNYRIERSSGDEQDVFLNGRLSWKGSKEFIEQEIVVLRAAAR